jgi:hypothetical protein
MTQENQISNTSINTFPCLSCDDEPCINQCNLCAYAEKELTK